MKRQKGNLLTDALGFFVFIILVLFLLAMLFFPSSSISIERNQELKEMIGNLEKTSFEPQFKNQIKLSLADGEISNREFNKLKDSYVNYQSSKLIDDTGESNQVIENQTSNEYNAYFLFFMIFVFALVLTFVGWRITTSVNKG